MGFADEMRAEMTAILKSQVEPAIRVAMDGVGADMRHALAHHVEKDVYEAYTPSMYERREDGLAAQAERATIYNRTAQVSIEFKPHGDHPAEDEWRERGVFPVHADELIGRIERWSPRYSFIPRRRRIPNRPFWQKFVNDMVDQGGLALSFHTHLSETLPKDMMLEMDGAVERESEDGAY